MDTRVIDLSDVRAKLQAAARLCPKPLNARERRAMVGLLLRLRHEPAVSIPHEIPAELHLRDWWTLPSIVSRKIRAQWLPSL